MDPSQKPQVQPGAATSEFWVTLGGITANIIAVLVLLGYVSASDANDLSQQVTQLLGGLQVVAVNAALIWKYVDSRQKAKSDALQHETLRLNAASELATTKQQLASLTSQLLPGLQRPVQIMTAVPAPGVVFADPAAYVAPQPPTQS